MGKKNKGAAVENNENDLRKIMEPYEKLDEIVNEDYEMKPYLQSMNLYDARMMFRIRSKMVKCKMNFSSDKGNCAAM